MNWQMRFATGAMKHVRSGRLPEVDPGQGHPAVAPTRWPGLEDAHGLAEDCDINLEPRR